MSGDGCGEAHSYEVSGGTYGIGCTITSLLFLGRMGGGDLGGGPKGAVSSVLLSGGVGAWGDLPCASMVYVVRKRWRIRGFF